MILYHGTIYRNYLHIKKGIEVGINFDDAHELDYGYGFYMSTKAGYAARLIASKAGALKLGPGYDPVLDRPVIVILDVDTAGMLADTGNDRLIIKHRSFKFARMVFDARYHRAGTDTIGKSLVVGPIADGGVDNVMPWFRECETRIRKLFCLIRYLIPTFPLFSRQWVVKSQDLCHYITVKGFYEMKGEKIWLL